MSSHINMDLGGMMTLGEKRKMLNQFVARAERHEVDNILNDCEDRQPASLFNLVKFLLADKFHRFDLMIGLLYAGGDTQLLNGILSKRWLYEGEKDSLTDSRFLLEQLFPQVSYICRRKVLHKIGRYARNEAKVDQLWNAVEQMYGFDVAFPLFEACSKNMITSVIANREVRLSGYQVVTLLRKYPEVGLEYFKNNSVTCSKMNPQCSPIHYLYKHRPDDFLDLYANHSHKLEGFKIGRRRSTKMIRVHRVQLLEHPKKTNSLLKLDRIRREFTAKEFQMLFESTLPPDPGNVRQCWEWVRIVPTYKQISMVNQAYANLYKIDVNEHVHFLSEEYIFLLPDERRLQIIERKIDNIKLEYSSWSFKGISECVYGERKKCAALYLPLKPISHSAPELKKLLLVEQDVDMRAKLSRYLIETCFFNDDLPEFLSVLKLLSQRSRNDRPEVRREIFETLDKIGKMEFSKEHWDIIMEMIRVSLVFEDGDEERCDHEKDRIISKYIAFLLKSKLPLDDIVTMQIRLKMRRYRNISLENEYIESPADKRMLLEMYAKELENLQLTNNASDSNLTEFVVQLIDKIWHFNKGSDVETISLSSHPWLISNYERIAKEAEQQLNERCAEPATLPTKRIYSRRSCRGYSFWILPNKFLKRIQWLKDEHNQTIDAFHGSDYYFSKMWLCLPNHQTIRHFLKKNPSHLLENWTASISKMLGTKACVALMRSLKYWNYSALVSRTTNDCRELAAAALGDKPDKVQIDRKANALLVLSVLMEPSDFLALMTQFYPTDNKVDVSAENSNEDYKMRETITRSLINISVPHLAFDAIKKFCVGDYLKLVIDSLYAQIQRAQSVKSLDFLRQQLANVPVSLHKHIIRLYCTISSVDDKLLGLKGVEISNVSIRYVVFQHSSTLFRSHPSQETWTMLKTIIDSTREEDATILKFLHSTPQLQSCPSDYISDYIGVCLTVLRKLEPSEVDTFIGHLLQIIKKIPAHLLDEILMHDFENAESFNSALCVAYLKNSLSESTLQHRLANIWRILDNVIGRYWDRKTENQSYPTRSLVLNFIGDLANQIGSEAWLENLICRTLLDKFKGLSTTKFFLEIFTLYMALLHVEVIEYGGADRIRRFGSSFARFVDFLVESYAGEIIFMATTMMESFIRGIFSTEISKNESVIVELVAEMFKTSRTRANQIFAIKFLKDANPKERNGIEMLEKINRIFIESDDVVVKTYYASLHH